MRTTEKGFGRWGDVCSDQTSETISTLASARKLFADLKRQLEGEIDRLQSVETESRDEDRIKLATELIARTQKALQTVLDVEVRLMRQADAQEAKAGMIDLDEARAEITRRLARLAA